MKRKIDKGTIIRLVMIVSSFVVDLVAICTGTSFGNNPIFACICAVLTVLSVGLAYWYNNDFTSLAMLCRDVFDMLQDGKISAAELEALIKKHKEGNDDD